MLLLSLVLLRFWRAAQASWTFHQQVLPHKIGRASGALLEQWPQMEWMQEPSNAGSSLQITSSVLEQLQYATASNSQQQPATTYHSSMIHNVSYCIIVCAIAWFLNLSTWSQHPP